LTFFKRLAHIYPLLLPTSSDLITSIQEANSIDNDVRSKYNQYNSLRTNLQALQRKQTGNLSTKSLISVVSPNVLVSDSEHLETHLIAVPNNSVKDFMRSYETLAPFVVPRSANFVASDDEFSLYAVTTFKKHSAEFVHKVREKKWVPRDYKFKEGGKEEEAQEVRKTEAEEKRVWGETLRLGRTGWSEGVMCLVHVDKKGRPKKDEGMSSADVATAAAGGEQGDYSAYVLYQIAVD
jgi:V-type H+-transporting ATPase subunit C